jgi:hypothetical protein
MNKFTKVLRLFAAIAAATGIATAAQASWVPKRRGRGRGG